MSFSPDPSDSDSDFEQVPASGEAEYKLLRAKLRTAKDEVKELREKARQDKKNFDCYKKNYDQLEAISEERLSSSKEAGREAAKDTAKALEHSNQLAAKLQQLTEERSEEDKLSKQLRDSAALEITDLRAQLIDSRRACQELQGFLDQKRDVEVRLQNSQAECNHLRSEAETLRNEVLLKHQETEGLRSQLTVTQGQATELESSDRGHFEDLFQKVGEAESDRATLAAENAVLQEELEELRGSVREKDELVQAMMTQHEELSQQSKMLQEEVESSRMIAGECTARNVELAEARDRASEVYARSEQEKVELEGRIAELQERSQLAEQHPPPTANAANAHPGPPPAGA